MPLMLLTLTTGLVLGALAPVVAPALAPAFAPERNRATWVTSVLLGVSGALVGGHFGQLLGWYDTGREAGLLMSVLCAIAALVAFHALMGRRVSR